MKLLTSTTLLFLLVIVFSGSVSGQDFEETKRLAEQGDATAQYNLGNMYDSGRVVPENDAEAVRWYRLAAEQGDAAAQNNLGFMYARGEGVPEDDVEAVKWYRLAAEQGDATAQTNLGVMYAIGAGLRQNNVRAYAWFSVAAAQGDEDARSKRDIISETLTPEQLPNGTVSKHSLVLPIAEFYREVRSILPTSTSSTQL